MLSWIEIGGIETEERVFGLDLDDTVSVDGGSDGCGFMDDIAPEPFGVQGVDNRLGPMIDFWRGSPDTRLAYVRDIRRGELLYVLSVHGVDDVENDTCVHVRFGSATHIGPAPLRTTLEGYLEPDQEFDARSDEPAFQSLDAEIVDGFLRASLSPSGFPIYVTDRVGVAELASAKLMLQVSGVGAEGLLGGSVDETTSLSAIEEDSCTVIRCGLLSSLDMPIAGRDDAGCARISTAFRFATVPARVRGQ